MSLLNYCQPNDIAERIAFRKRHWFHGNPDICLIGEQNKFGELIFDFHDVVVKFSIYIKNRNKILDAAHLAIMNFNKYWEEMR